MRCYTTREAHATCTAQTHVFAHLIVEFAHGSVVPSGSLLESPAGAPPPAELPAGAPPPAELAHLGQYTQ